MDQRKDAKKADVPKLTPGSRYRIISMMTRDEPLTTEGEFKGYTAIGSMDAICMEIDAPGEGGPSTSGEKGRKKVERILRLIPGQMVIAIDILDQAKEKAEEKSTTDSRAYM